MSGSSLVEWFTASPNREPLAGIGRVRDRAGLDADAVFVAGVPNPRAFLSPTIGV